MSGLRHSDWHLISEQRFRRRAGLSLVSQRFRGAPYVVICDQLTGQYLRMNARAQMLWSRLDGARNMHEIWRDLAVLPGGAALGQNELMDWVLQLASAGLILSDHDIDPKHLTKRARAKRDMLLEAKAISPLALKVPLFDPAPFIRATYPWVAPLFSRAGVLVLALILALGGLFGGLYADQLWASTGAHLLSQGSLFAMFLAYPVMKALHEAGHAYVLHHYGGEVREAGVMFLIFFPVPYVDASSAAAIPEPRARMWVSAAGMVIELAVAALATVLWSQAEAGLLHAVLYSFIVMGTLSTLAFNGNPLLKFDAYYVLSDWLEIPNLAQRAGAVLQDRFLSRVLGLRGQEAVAPDQLPIFVIYGTLSLVYRLMLSVVIVLVVAQVFYALGLILAAWSVATSVLWPLVKLVKKGREMAQAENARRRVGLRLGVVVTAIVALGAGLPLPFSASGEGRVIARPMAEIRAQTSGFVAAGASLEKSAQAEGDVIAVLTDPDQAARLAAMGLALTDVEARLGAAGLSVLDRRVLEARARALQASLAQAEMLHQGLDLRAPKAGVVMWREGHPLLEGAFVNRGDVLGHMAGAGLFEAVVALPAAFGGVLPADGAAVSLRLSDGRVLEARLAQRRLIGAGEVVPAALRASSGGPIAQAPGRPETALAPALAVWLEFDPTLEAVVGQHLDAKVDLAAKPLFAQIWFHLERAFLRVTRL